MKRRTIIVLTSLVALSLVAAACGGSSDSSSSSGGGGSTKGGTIREETQSFGWTNDFDPTGEYLGTAWAFYDQLLMRGLYTYNHRPAEEGGNAPILDLAASEPTVSEDGLTWEFTLKTGVKYAPPLNREVTSKDIAFAFQRINTASLVAQYGNYYCGIVEGMDCAAKKQTDKISGISTPDDTHITFTLTQPTGDFTYRLAMPATKAIPEEVAGCFDKAGDYGNYVFSSGPYMIEGTDQLDISSCDTLKPLSGYNVEKGMTLVRNPNYDPATDDPNSREANADGIQVAINTNYNDSFQKLLDGELDEVPGTPPKNVLLKFETDPAYANWLHADDADRTWYITMNLIAPPFDDVHIRRAVNFALDKEGVRKAYGGEKRGELATSVEPPTVLPQSATIDPYGTATTPNGNIDAAKEEIKQSIYDKDKNGVCDDGGACDNIVFLGRTEDPWPEMNQVGLESLKPILPGLTLKEVDTSTAYTTLQDMPKLIPIALVPGWGKDYNSPYGFDYYIFSSDGIFACTAATNYSLLGLTKEILDKIDPSGKGCGVTDQLAAYEKQWGPVPDVSDAINECAQEATPDAVNQCFTDKVDTPLMEDIVPWVPWVWATNWTSANTDTMTNYVYDGNAGWISYVNSSVNNGLQPENVA